jgi:hypothetical protein
MAEDRNNVRGMTTGRDYQKVRTTIVGSKPAMCACMLTCSELIQVKEPHLAVTIMLAFSAVSAYPSQVSRLITTPTPSKACQMKSR